MAVIGELLGIVIFGFLILGIIVILAEIEDWKNS